MVSMVLICVDPNRRCHDHHDPNTYYYNNCSTGRYLLLLVS